MKVMKFGGSSIADAERIRHVAKIIKMNLEDKPVIVFSAMGKTTDNLIAAAQCAINGEISTKEIEDLHHKTAEEFGITKDSFEPLLVDLQSALNGITQRKELLPQDLDYIVSFGERLSVRIIASYLTKEGIPAKHYDASDAGFVTDSHFTNAEILDATYDNVQKIFGDVVQEYRHTPIVTGFIARDQHGQITTTGRGGSDLTASILGKALGADEIIVWKDVDGILTTDPRVVPSAIPVTCVSFKEASEMAYFGAKVLHPRSILPAMQADIPVCVRNSYNPNHPGTIIVHKREDDGNLVRAISFKRNVTVIFICSTYMLGQYGFLAKVFEVFDKLKLSVDMVATSEVSISVTLDEDQDYERLEEGLKELATVKVKRNKAIVSLISNVDRSTAILDKAFSLLNENNIEVQMLSQGASRVNIGFVVNDEDYERSVKLLHEYFFENGGTRQ